MSRKTTHVVHNPKGGWDVKEGGGRVRYHSERKQDAVDEGRGISKDRRSEFIIHRKDGTIQKTDSHGGDPSPPKDKR